MTDAAVNRPRVLIVEDDGDQRTLLCETVRMHYGPAAEAGIVGVGTGRECLAQDLAAFDVVLLDYHLPDVEGIRLLEEVLAAADVPVIFVTGENDSAVAAEAIKRGAQDYVVKLGDYLFAIPVVIEKSISQHRIRSENERLRAQLELMLEELRVKNTQLEESLQKLRTMATTDHLTRLSNRRRFSEDLQRQFSEAMRYGRDLTCCMCDLDNYKQLNDTLGHQLGDEILMVTARVIRRVLRLSDTAARYGGDEFVLLLPNTGCREAQAVSRRLREQVAAGISQCADFSCSVTLSVGIASVRADHPASADTLISMADRALYAAKAAGRDRIVLYSQIAQAAEQHA
jgi:diguanylate cyclase (GGDEF)-like protein